MAKLKDLLNENSFSLVGGVVSTPASLLEQTQSY